MHASDGWSQADWRTLARPSSSGGGESAHDLARRPGGAAAAGSYHVAHAQSHGLVRRQPAERSAHPFPAAPFQSTPAARVNPTTKPRLPREATQRRERRVNGAADFRALEEQTRLYMHERQPSHQQQQQQLMPPLQHLPHQHAPTAWQQSVGWNSAPPPQHPAYVPQFQPSPPPVPVHSLGSSYSTVPLSDLEHAPVGGHSGGPPHRTLRPASAPPARLAEQAMQAAAASPSVHSRPSAAELMRHKATPPMQPSPPQHPFSLSQPMASHDEKEETQAFNPASTQPISSQPLSRHEQMYSSLLRQSQSGSSSTAQLPTPPPSSAPAARADPWSALYMERLSAKQEMGVSEAVFFARSSRALAKQVSQPGSMFDTNTRLMRRQGWWQPEPPISTLHSQAEHDAGNGSIAWINPTPLPQMLQEQAATKQARRGFKPSPQFSQQVWEEPTAHEWQPQLHLAPAQSQLYSPSHQSSHHHSSPAVPPSLTSATPPASSPAMAVLSHFQHAPSSLFLGGVNEPMVSFLVESCAGATTKELLAFLWKMELSQGGASADHGDDANSTLHSLVLPFDSWGQLVDAVVALYEEAKYASYVQRKTLQRYLQSGASAALLRSDAWGSEWGPSQDTLEKMLRVGASGASSTQAQQVIFHLQVLQSSGPLASLDQLLGALAAQLRYSTHSIRELANWLAHDRCGLFQPGPTTSVSLAECTSFWFTHGLPSSSGETLPQLLQRISQEVVSGRERPLRDLYELGSVVERIHTGSYVAPTQVRAPQYAPPQPHRSSPSPHRSPVHPRMSAPLSTRSAPSPHAPPHHSQQSSYDRSGYPQIRDVHDDEEEEDDERFHFEPASDFSPQQNRQQRPPQGVQPRHQPQQSSQSIDDPIIHDRDHRSASPNEDDKPTRPSSAASTHSSSQVPTSARPSASNQPPPSGLVLSDSEAEDEGADRARELKAREELQAKWAAEAAQQKQKQEAAQAKDSAPSATPPVEAATPAPVAAPVAQSAPTLSAEAKPAASVRFADDSKPAGEVAPAPTPAATAVPVASPLAAVTSAPTVAPVVPTPTVVAAAPTPAVSVVTPAAVIAPAVEAKPIVDLAAPVIAPVVIVPVAAAAPTPVVPTPVVAAPAAVVAPASPAIAAAPAPLLNLIRLDAPRPGTSPLRGPMVSPVKPMSALAKLASMSRAALAAKVAAQVTAAAPVAPTPAPAAPAALESIAEHAAVPSPADVIQPSTVSSMTLLPAAAAQPVALSTDSLDASLAITPSLMSALASPLAPRSPVLAAQAATTETPMRLSITGEAGQTALLTPSPAVPTPAPVVAAPAPFNEDSACDLCFKRNATLECLECDLHLCDVGPGEPGCDSDVHRAPSRSAHVRKPWSLEIERATEVVAAAAAAERAKTPLSAIRRPSLVIPPLQLSGLISPDRRTTPIQLPISTPPSSSALAARRTSVLGHGGLSLSLGVSPLMSLGGSPGGSSTPVTGSTGPVLRTLTAPSLSALMAPLPASLTASPSLTARASPSLPSPIPSSKTAPVCDICDEEASVVHCAACGLDLCADDDFQIHKPASKQGHQRTRH